MIGFEIVVVVITQEGLVIIFLLFYSVFLGILSAYVVAFTEIFLNMNMGIKIYFLFRWCFYLLFLNSFLLFLLMMDYYYYLDLGWNY